MSATASKYPTTVSELSPSIRLLYVSMRELPDGRVCGVLRLLYHWTLHVDVHAYGYEDRYCFETREGAEKAMREWDGMGDPGTGWHRHPKSGRRRDPRTGREWTDD